MFTGIIQEIGTIAARRAKGGVTQLVIEAPALAPAMVPMESIAVNGVCLTVVERRGGRVTVEVIRETADLTTLGRLREGSRVNLEPSLRVADRFNGHVVLGHVDGTGTIMKRLQRPGELVLTITLPATFRPYLVPKGPMTVHGVSLTVGRAPTRTSFTIHLIPETLRRTILGELRLRDPVNLEIDYLAKVILQGRAR